MGSPLKPTFVGVGAKKSASTWLSECLRQHPEVFMTNPKETHYFSTSSGLDGYLEFFKDSEGHKAIGEFTPNYLPEASVVAERIRETLGPVKILAILRDPVQRYVSHYKWFLGRLKNLDKETFQSLDEETFEKANVANDNMLVCGFYSEKLELFTRLFGAENVHTMIYEEVFAEPETELRKMYAFLGVDSDTLPPVANRRVRQGYVPKFPVLERGRKNAYRFIKKNAPGTIEYIRRMRLEDLLRRFNRKKEPFRVDEAVLRRLDVYYRDEIHEMRRFLNKDLAQWGLPRSR